MTQKTLNRKIQAVLYLFLFFANFSLSSQRNGPNFAIKKYGKTIENPFHSANNLRQDSLGRLVFDSNNKTWIFDGERFLGSEENEKSNYTHLLTEINGSKWYSLKDDPLIYETSDSTYRFSVDQFDEKNTCCTRS
ncbi:MAG: hypothetical protein AAGK97_04720, partial [Bacteroidota bacterium]